MDNRLENDRVGAESRTAGDVSASDAPARKRTGRDAPPTRRAFIVAAACIAGGLAVGAAVRPLAARADELRPPGSLAEPLFTALCIKCQRCVTVCPEHVILPSVVEDGVVQARMPKLAYESAGCTFCDKCHEVCPTMAISKPDPYAPLEGRIGIAAVYPSTCIPFSNPSSCGVCRDACPYGAISLDDEGRPMVDESRCNGCGLCEAKCPANVAMSFGGSGTRGIGVVTEETYRAQGGAWNA